MLTYIGVGFALSVLLILGNAKASGMWNDNCRVHVFFMPILSSTLGPKRAMVDTVLEYSFVIKINNLK